MSQDKSFSYKKAETSPLMGLGAEMPHSGPEVAWTILREKPTACGRMRWPFVVTGMKHGGPLAEHFCQLGITRSSTQPLRVKASGNLVHGGFPSPGPIQSILLPLQDPDQATGFPRSSVFSDFLTFMTLGPWISGQILGMQPYMLQTFSVEVNKAYGKGLTVN